MAFCIQWIGLREILNRKPMGFYHQIDPEIWSKPITRQARSDFARWVLSTVKGRESKVQSVVSWRRGEELLTGFGYVILYILYILYYICYI